ncbi:MAG: phosphoglycerate mutase (2,3-diphosphoglycerate-independent) [Methylomonas sp.]|nr:MAG: phosphoglycerate mutase (2,3-diphosphoglycerate-independent) [Methylobacter sp.]PPD34172.1 MAG: phosphoglycerate mutase (2,3-diphosphoglycerate-independent) [Methylomonas sp.]
MSNTPKPVVLLILDGFGYTPETKSNAIAMAETPCWDNLQKQFPMTLLDCSGAIVGLPDGQMGNSEVGHLHIGSGRYVPQELARVFDAIKDGSFYANRTLCKACDTAKANNKALHILGLLSPGGVHSHEDQIAAMVELAARRGVAQIFVHAFLDGRDVPPKSAAASIQRMEAVLARLGTGKIASVCGRFYAMDRDKRWDRVKAAYDMLVKGEAGHQADSALKALEDAYGRGETDEFVAPTCILNEQQQAVKLDPEDSVVFMNFRADRARELCQALTDPEFNGFERNHAPHNGYFATLTQYHEKFPYDVGYEPIAIKNGLGEILSKHGLKQLRLAETEKYAHVTFFINGGMDEPFPGEDRVLVPSPQVKTYDLQPEMSSAEVTGHLVKAILEKQYDVIICNYANCDMVGHTGVLGAAITAVEAVDHCLQQITDALLQVGGQMLLTADHGNIEQMVDEATGQPHTAHTTNPVPLVYVGGSRALKNGGNLSDLAPTLLAILGIEQPAEMNGQPLLQNT